MREGNRGLGGGAGCGVWGGGRGKLCNFRCATTTGVMGDGFWKGGCVCVNEWVRGGIFFLPVLFCFIV